jgi:ribonuclease G
MSKEIYISSTPHETRLAIVENDVLVEIYYERENEYTLAGSIYNGRVTRVLPGMQSSFVDIGLERDAFLYITDFMEETEEDSADFDASAGNGARPRNGNGDRNGRDRSPREAQPRLAEPSDADLFVQAVSGLDPSRPVIEGERAERTDRGDRDRGRRGGRNRGNRGGNREVRPDELRAPSTEAAAPVAGNIPVVDSQDEVGEGLPGADGSRRWRGRRGRRGNRGPRPEGAAPGANEAVSAQPLSSQYNSEPVEFEPGIDTLDEPIAAAAEILPTDTEHAAFRERISSGDRGPRNERGGRGDRNERGDRGRRDRGPATPPRVPRGFAPSTSLYKVEKDEHQYGVEPEVEAPLEPIILPGESLSKYRTPSETPGVAAAVTAPAAPVSDFVVEGWDGGLVLPGETLRPRTGAPAPYRNDTVGRGDRDRDRRRGDRDRGRGERSEGGLRQPSPDFERPIGAPAAQEASFIEVPTYLSEPEQVPATHLVTPVHSTFVPPPPVPSGAHEVVEAPPMLDEPVAAVEPIGAAEPAIEVPDLLAGVEVPTIEYEPEEASASYRVDPVAPREFRQSAPVLDEQASEEQIADEPFNAEPESTKFAEFSPEPESFALVEKPTYVPAVEVPIELAQDSAIQHEPTAEFHEVTAISETGDMHSEPAAVSERDYPLQEHAEPSSPIKQEGAIVDGIVPAAIPYAPVASYFEPGAGLLEEEVLEEDDETSVIHAIGAHSAAEFQQQEQETLENASDLGTMIREMSIDHLTRTEPALDEEDDEDDFEEDFLEEDQDFDSEEVENEEESVEEVAFGEIGNESELENGELGEPGGVFEDAAPRELAEGAEYARPAAREPRRDGRGDKDRGRGRDARRDGRGDRGGRDRRPGYGDRGYGSGSSDRGRHEGHGRQSMQATNLPAISDLLKPGQEILVQIAKEPIAKKGARITSHIALPGRFLVFMPTVSHTGVSRKIESDGERRRLKEILLSEKGDAQGGFIVRTAAAGASEEELRSDLRFLLNLWADIKARSESSKSPALIYHDLNLIERVLRDQVTDNFSAIWVDSETEYERVLRFLQRFQPSLIRRVKLYTKETPLFEQFGITEEINKALRSKVWLKSGGSIVINQTEALVAIDINTGKYVGKTARLEDTIVKTNLDAIPEIVRQIRLRDLGGIIIIDFIDMDERKNRNKVMMALEEELKLDRAPSKVLQFNDFGLVAITRKRVKQSLERTLSTTCSICAGTGMVKSPVTVCNDIYVEMRKMAKHLDRGDVMLRVHPDVVKQLKAPSTHWLQEMEEMCGKTILVKSDPSLHPEQFDIH